MVPGGGRRAVTCGGGPWHRPSLPLPTPPMIRVGEPAAVESERDPGWQVHTGDRLGGEVLGGEDDQVGGTAVGGVDEGHDVAVVFGGGWEMARSSTRGNSWGRSSRRCWVTVTAAGSMIHRSSVSGPRPDSAETS